MVTEFDKAIVALVVPILVFVLARVGFNADDSVTAAITTILTAILVYLTPNKPAAA